MPQGIAYKPSDADRYFVDRAVMAGSSLAMIAQALNIAQTTLREHYRYEIATAQERLKNSAIRVLNEHLDDNSLDAAKFVLARRAGWTEKQQLEHTSPDGSMTPQRIEIISVPSCWAVPEDDDEGSGGADPAA